MIPLIFCLYNDEPICFSENGAQVFRDLVDALKDRRPLGDTMTSMQET